MHEKYRLEEKLEKLKNILFQKEEEIKFLKENVVKNIEGICWWNNKKCPYCQDIKGLEDARSFCADCYVLDEERLSDILSQNFKGIFYSRKDLEKELEESRKEHDREAEDELNEKIGEVYNEISEKIDDLISGE